MRDLAIILLALPRIIVQAIRTWRPSGHGQGITIRQRVRFAVLAAKSARLQMALFSSALDAMRAVPVPKPEQDRADQMRDLGCCTLCGAINCDGSHR